MILDFLFKTDIQRHVERKAKVENPKVFLRNNNMPVFYFRR